MKRLLISTILIVLTLSLSAMSLTKIRSHARFLTDRMAYELDMSSDQYDDCFEINYDFIYAIESVMDDVAYGYEDAIDEYYRYLDYRNEDLSYVLDYIQYSKFLNTEYFVRPIYTVGNSWNFRIYTIYNNVSFYYFDKPSIYNTYIGSHSRKFYLRSYYEPRYNHSNKYVYNPLRGNANIIVYRRNDFGANLRKRGDVRIYNNYNNKNANNRTNDARYRDDSGNRFSPGINNRIVTGRKEDVPSISNGVVNSQRQGNARLDNNKSRSIAIDEDNSSSRYRVEPKSADTSRSGAEKKDSNNKTSNSGVRVGRR